MNMSSKASVEKYETFSSDETFELGVKFGEKAEAGSVYSLAGDLGAGKTVFDKIGLYYRRCSK